MTSSLDVTPVPQVCAVLPPQDPRAVDASTRQTPFTVTVIFCLVCYFNATVYGQRPPTHYQLLTLKCVYGSSPRNETATNRKAQQLTQFAVTYKFCRRHEKVGFTEITALRLLRTDIYNGLAHPSSLLMTFCKLCSCRTPLR